MVSAGVQSAGMGALTGLGDLGAGATLAVGVVAGDGVAGENGDASGACAAHTDGSPDVFLVDVSTDVLGVPSFGTLPPLFWHFAWCQIGTLPPHFGTLPSVPYWHFARCQVGTLPADLALCPSVPYWHFARFHLIAVRCGFGRH